MKSSSSNERPVTLASKNPPPSVQAAVGPFDSDAETLVIDEQDRYGRLRLISWWRQERLAAARVLVVGAGALGNEVVKNLALVGLGTTYLIDVGEETEPDIRHDVTVNGDDGELGVELS